ncbi:substrate-binding and VWA domain-containing protein [Micromonospora zhanjiangensis]
MVLVVTGAWFGYQKFTEPACSGELRIRVAATPEMAPAVQAAAAKWSSDGAAVGGVCVVADVQAAEPVDVAAAVAGQHGVTLPGVGQASGDAVLPDVWVPDSSTWLLRLQKAAAGFAPSNRASIARSPVVVAMPEPVAATLGWPDKKLTWNDLLGQLTTGTKLKAGIVEPSRDAAGLSGLLSISQAAATAGPDAQRQTTGALRALAATKSVLREDLLQRFPRAGDPAAIAAALSAAAMSEEDVIYYNAKKPPIPLAALYLEPAPISLDYPYAVMPGIDPARAAAAGRLFELLNTAGFRDRLGAQGLRAPDGTVTPGLSAPQGAPSPAGSPPGATTPQPGGTAAAGGLAADVVERALSTWSIATQSGRMLAVIDVSGSMERTVPTANNATREQVTVAAASKGLGLFDDSWAIGLWTFSTNMVGSQPWKQLVPIGPLSSQRTKLLAGLTTVVPKPDGNTGLFDTTLAAYKAVQDGWEPGKVNSVVLFTDGKNENPGGLTQQQLIAKLKAAIDPERPVQVIIIGIGRDVSRAELEAIVKVTGGGQFVTEDPAEIGTIFLKAISLRPPATR